VINSIHLKLSLIIPFIIDLLYFRKFTYTLYNFIKFNIIDGKSALFGKANFDYYYKITYPNYLNEEFRYFLLGIGLFVAEILFQIIRLLIRKIRRIKKEVENGKIK